MASLRVLSIDMGTRHLALAKLRVDADGFDVERWEVLDVASAAGMGDTDIGGSSTGQLVPIFTKALPPLLPSWLDGVDALYIEQQPLGGSRGVSNAPTYGLSVLLHGLCLLQRPDVRVVYVSPQKKLRGLRGAEDEPATDGDGDDAANSKKRYRDNKKLVIGRAQQWLDHSPRTQAWGAWFRAVGGKRDDYADALVQGVVAARDEMREAAAARAKAARKQDKAVAKDAKAAAKAARAAARAAKAAAKAAKDAPSAGTKRPREDVDEDPRPCPIGTCGGPAGGEEEDAPAGERLPSGATTAEPNSAASSSSAPHGMPATKRRKPSKAMRAAAERTAVNRHAEAQLVAALRE